MATAHAFQAELWRYEGEAGWFFLSLPYELADAIEHENGPPDIKGFGAVRVSVRIGASRWDTSVFPDRARGTYLLPVKKSIRLAENLEAGDTVPVELTVLD
jgi:hypothetical protein